MKLKIKIALEYKIVIFYFIAGFLWILLSDKFVLMMDNGNAGPETITLLQTYKGWFFIIITAILLYVLIHKDTIRRNHIEQELSAARQKAEEAEKLKNAFLANISHEIRTPLNGIIGFSELLNDNEITKKELTDYTDHILQNSQQLLSAINSIIELSQLEVNAVKLNPTNCNLKNIIQSVYQTSLNLQMDLNKENVVIDVKNNVPDDHCEIYADESKLRHILMILIHNALKYSEKGKIIISAQIQNKNEICFSVSDEGVGIPQAQHGKIFQSFNTIEHSNPDKLHGFGLGLSIAKGWVGLMNGKIWVESSHKTGSVFSFSIPIEQPKMDEDEFTNIRRQIPDLTGKTILIVEDIDYCYEYLYELLKHSHTNILWALDGNDGIQQYQNHKPDIIILDLLLPVLNGMDVAKEIRKKDKETILIGVSAFAHENEKQKCIEAGFNDYITKPVKPMELIQSLKTFAA